jgi:hypothetical protein
MSGERFFTFQTDFSATRLMIGRIGDNRIENPGAKETIRVPDVPAHHTHTPFQPVQANASHGAIREGFLNLEAYHGHCGFVYRKSEGDGPAACACVENQLTRLRTCEPRQKHRVLGNPVPPLRLDYVDLVSQ